MTKGKHMTMKHQSFFSAGKKAWPLPLFPALLLTGACFITSLPVHAAEKNSKSYLVRSYTIYLKTPKLQDSVQYILLQTHKRNGFLIQQRSSPGSEWMQVKIPADQDVTGLLNGLRELGLVARQDKSFTNAAEDILQLKGRIKSLQKFLASLYDLYKTAGLQQSIEVEKNINKTIEKLEAAKGKYRYIINQTQHIRISVHFSFPQVKKQKAMDYGVPWLKQVNISSFIQSFDRER